MSAQRRGVAAVTVSPTWTAISLAWLVGLGPVPSRPNSYSIGSFSARAVKIWQNFVEFTLKFVQGTGMIIQSSAVNIIMVP